MAARDVVVIGASAGGVEALRELVARLPADFPGAVLVVLHVAPTTPSVLPRILERTGRLPVVHAAHGMPIERGRIHIAPPNRHMVVHGGELHLVAGPREHGTRPAVDPLFRSAARAFGPRVVGVVLTGNLGDGAAGLALIKQAGGVALVQDPAECLFDGMPRTAIELVDVDVVEPLAGIAAHLVELAGGAPARGRMVLMTDEVEREQPMTGHRDAELAARIDEGARRNEGLGGHLSGYTCPECHGALWEVPSGPVVGYRCRVGHAFSEESLLVQQGGALEAALWSALVALEEHASLTWRMARRAEAAGMETRRLRYENKARELEASAQIIRESLRVTAPLVADDDTVTA